MLFALEVYSQNLKYQYQYFLIHYFQGCFAPMLAESNTKEHNNYGCIKNISIFYILDIIKFKVLHNHKYMS